MTATWRKSKALFAIYFQEGLAYRASGLIWVMTDVTTAITMPLVWAAAAKSGKIAGFSTSDFVLYYLCLLLIQCFVTSHIMWDVATEIKEGQFITALLRPVNWYLLTFIRNLAWRVFRPLLFLPFFFLFLWLYRGMLGDAHISLSPAFFLSVVLGHVLSFAMVTMLSMIALFTQEAMSIFELYYLPALLLSGSVFPVSVMPAWAQSIAHVLPFYVTAGAPTEILIGRVPQSGIPAIIATQVVWIAIAYVGFRILWSRGLTRYAGAGN
jgi:ABC-2 type transport system permease protein